MTPESPTSTDRSPADVALACARRLWEDDTASRALGIRLVSVGPGRADLAMTVVPSMVNGIGLCHGGHLALLADSAMAFACNTYDDATVTAGFDVDFVAPVRLGDELVASARERVRRGRSGLYDVTVRRTGPGPLPPGTDPLGEVVCELRGRSRSLGRPILAAAPG